MLGHFDQKLGQKYGQKFGQKWVMFGRTAFLADRSYTNFITLFGG